MTQLTDERVRHIADTLAALTHLAHDLLEEVYSNEAIGEAMMEGAFHTLKHDGALFLTVLERFRQGYKL
ncbi:hypothetical protein [Methylobacterium phyllosphaerae]|uniref:hypothetical protein n=1 Tax=Methylobacterium phyllosphaerae TaxID=418223 RepID=UPI000AEA1CF8|nr:hypothetical protein [Methylobacterium phyllosphaerae]